MIHCNCQRSCLSDHYARTLLVHPRRDLFNACTIRLRSAARPSGICSTKRPEFDSYRFEDLIMKRASTIAHSCRAFPFLNGTFFTCSEPRYSREEGDDDSGSRDKNCIVRCHVPHNRLIVSNWSIPWYKDYTDCRISTPFIL